MHTLALAEALAVLGVDVTVVSLARGGDTGFFRAVDRRVTVSLVEFSDLAEETVGERIVRSIVALRDGIEWSEFDLVHAQDCISANAVERCIRTIHHLDQFTTPELIECHEKAIVRPFAHICVSNAVAAEVEAGWGLHPTVIHNGVDSERFAAAASSRPSAVASRFRWAHKFGAPYVLTVGGIEPRKGTLELVEAFALVRADLPGLRLVVAGGETLFDYRSYRTLVDTRCIELGVEPLVLGPVHDDELPALVATASVVAQTSTKEGFGMAAMEALAAGAPLVLSDLPVFREVFGSAALFGEGPAGLAAALAHACAGVDVDRCDRGVALAAAHTWSAAAEAHLAFYEDCLDDEREVGRTASVSIHRWLSDQV